ncbi:creatininase family protein [Eubacteriales bacterium OttesenSCG-928-N14]|nr:creatininase family protein [Eubacteriales bacterium OttesenSCG-928-N14]
MKMADMTFNEVKDYLQSNDTLIIPVGTCEQHGYHLPLNNDILCVEFFADILSQRTGDLIAPTINYGINLPCDKLFSGTTSITSETLQNTILSITDWWRSQGFQHFIVLTFHGDPFHIKALSHIGKDIFLIEPYEIEYSDVLERQSTMRHACEAETSIALYLHPEKVKMSLIREYDVPFDIFEDYLYHRMESPLENYAGNLGFPSAATAQKGEILVSRMIDKMLADYANLLKED